MSFKNIWHILLILSTFKPYNIYAEENRTEVMVDFRVNTSCIDPKFSDNSARINQILSSLDSLHSDTTRSIISVKFCGAASPEGPYEWNRKLAAARMASLEKLIRGKVEIPDSLIERDNNYIPWEFLKREIAASSLAYKDTIISIIDQEPVLVKDPLNGKNIDRRILRLRQLGGNRRIWNELFSLYFKRMRNASAVITTYRQNKPLLPALSELSLTMPDITPELIPADIGLLQLSESPRSPGKPFYMALYTNMLYDALAIPNLGAQFHLGKNWSIAGNWMHAWWNHDIRHRYWRLYGGELNVRYWFGKAAKKKPLTGHHVGVYVQALTYDFEWGGKAYMGGEPGGTLLDRAHWGGGIEYGYSLPIAKRLNIDFSLGVGYIGGRVYEFVPDGDRYLWTATKNKRWFGPTKLEVSLMWLIGRGNVNPGKGGRL